MLLATVLGLGLLGRTPPCQSVVRDAPGLVLVAQDDRGGTLRNDVADEFHKMNSMGQGIFNEDVTAVVAPYFPPGQTFEETIKTVWQQKLGMLRLFKGKQGPQDGAATYVTDFTLMSATFSHVYVVIDLSFDANTGGDMVVRKASAYLRASNM